jgi:GH15 family glucan-1,4-alpha-glucosidase
MGYLSLVDYGVIGNQSTAVLISRLGSIDWCCLPYLDSPSHFAALLDDNRGGRFQIAPEGDFHSEQNYFQRTNVLETVFETPTGRAILTDWMPIETDFTRDPTIYRRLEAVAGRIHFVVHCLPRSAYGAEGAQAELTRHGILFRGSALGDVALLHSSVPLQIHSEANAAHGRFTLEVGESANFSWTWGRRRPREEFPSPELTVEKWRSWAHICDPSGCIFAGPWHDMVIRSSLFLKLMITDFSGSIAEAITTSIPALSGGSRNWDYRYCWLRDSALALQALNGLNYRDEANTFFGWLSDIVIRDGAEGLQAVYTLDGGRFLPEHELTSLSGYLGSRPVRVGNLSAKLFQLDIYGHIMLAAAQYYGTLNTLPEMLWPRLVEIADYVCQAWRRPDRGPWEIRSKPEHFVGSKVLCWVALDRAIWLATNREVPVPHRWIEERDILHQTICDQGYDSIKHSFVRAFGSREVDAAALLIPLFGFLPLDDERVHNTLNTIQTELSDGVLLHRYRALDGLPESDGAHLLSSFWLVSCLALSGRVDEASDRLAELCTYASPLGLFGEQVNPATGQPAGNFPSASAHLALINACLYVGLARSHKTPGIPLVGYPRISTIARAA